MSKIITLTVQHEDGTSELLSQSTIVCPPATEDPPSRYVVKTDDLRVRSLPSLKGYCLTNVQTVANCLILDYSCGGSSYT